MQSKESVNKEILSVVVKPCICPVIVECNPFRTMKGFDPTRGGLNTFWTWAHCSIHWEIGNILRKEHDL